MTALRLAARRSWHRLRVPIVLVLALATGIQIGDAHWPYNLQSIEVEPQPVHAGGTVGITSVREFIDDCTLFFGRRLESVASPKTSPVLLPEERIDTAIEENGQPRTVWLQVPASFPCGAAQVRTSPSAACNKFQLWIWRQHQPDRLTPFDVACPSAPG